MWSWQSRGHPPSLVGFLDEDLTDRGSLARFFAIKKLSRREKVELVKRESLLLSFRVVPRCIDWLPSVVS